MLYICKKMSEYSYISEIIVAFEQCNGRTKYLGQLNLQDLYKLYNIDVDSDCDDLIGRLKINRKRRVYCKFLEDCNNLELDLIDNSEDAYLVADLTMYFISK